VCTTPRVRCRKRICRSCTGLTSYTWNISRRLAKQLEREGFEIGRLHVTTLMRRMGIEALYRRPRTSIAARGYDRAMIFIAPPQCWYRLLATLLAGLTRVATICTRYRSNNRDTKVAHAWRDWRWLLGS